MLSHWYKKPAPGVDRETDLALLNNALAHAAWNMPEDPVLFERYLQHLAAIGNLRFAVSALHDEEDASATDNVVPIKTA